MREHEVPTHVQAEDRVLLWFTFPQIVAMTAVCALAYGVYRYAPLGPSEVRMAAAVLFALAGLAVIAGASEAGGCRSWRPTCCGSGWGRGATPGLRPSWCGANHPHRRSPHPAAPGHGGCWRVACGASCAAGRGSGRRASAATGGCPFVRTASSASAGGRAARSRPRRNGRRRRSAAGGVSDAGACSRRSPSWRSPSPPRRCSRRWPRSRAGRAGSRRRSGSSLRRWCRDGGSSSRGSRSAANRQRSRCGPPRTWT